MLSPSSACQLILSFMCSWFLSHIRVSGFHHFHEVTMVTMGHACSFLLCLSKKKKSFPAMQIGRERTDPTVWRTISTLHSLGDSSLPGAGIGSELRLRKCSSLYLLKMSPRRWCMPLVYFLSPRVNQDLVDCAEFTGNMTVLFSLIARWNASHNLYSSKNKNKNRLGF